METKTCNICNIDKPIDEFYCVNERYHCRCKKCYNLKRKESPKYKATYPDVHYKTGQFDRVDKDYVRTELGKKTMYTKIARHIDVEIPTFMGWIRKGWFN